MTLEPANLFAGCKLPQPNRLVLATGKDVLAIGRDGNRLDLGGMPLEPSNFGCAGSDPTAAPFCPPRPRQTADHQERRLRFPPQFRAGRIAASATRLPASRTGQLKSDCFDSVFLAKALVLDRRLSGRTRINGLPSRVTLTQSSSTTAPCRIACHLYVPSFKRSS